MADLFAVLSERLAPAFAAVAGEADVDPVVRPSDRADAQANGALALGKRLGRNPREVAADVVAAADLDGVAATEIAGPGFINLTVDTSLLSSTLAEVATDPRLGIAADESRRYLVDYSAPNIAKELHIGHLRSTVIGDALVRMLMFLGHDVVRENHIGDWGRPFGILIEQLVESGAAANDELTLAETGELYKVATRRFADDPEFAERARARVVALQRREPETMAVWHRLVELSEARWQDDYAKLGVLLTVDDVVGESFYQDLMPAVIERLGAAGLVQESDGALVVFPPGFTNREGEPLPLIVRSSAGAFTYATSDLACVVDRVERVKAETLLYVIGAPQAQHLAMVFAVSAMAGWLQPPSAAMHIPFGHVLGTDGKMLRSRSGDPVALAEVVDEAIERGIAAVAAKNPELPAELAPVDRSCRRRRGVEVRRPVDGSGEGLHLRLGPHAVVRRQHGAVSAVRPHADLLVVPSCRDRAPRCPRGHGAGRGARGARLDAQVARLRGRTARVGRSLQPASAVHVSLRAGHGLHGVLRALPGAQGAERRGAGEPLGVERLDGTHARPRPRPARHRRPRADVICSGASG